MLEALKNFIRNLLNKKVVDLDNDGKIETLREEIQGLFYQFRNIHDKLGRANDELNEIVEDEQEEIRKAQERVNKAQAELKANKKLQEKVAEFLPENKE